MSSSNQCVSCSHYGRLRAFTTEELNEMPQAQFRKFMNAPHVCKAFPMGIPPGVVTGEISHLEPIEGDHGIQFNALP